MQPLENIIKCQNKKESQNFIRDFYTDNICFSTINNLSIILNHYNSIIVILHKIKSLHFNDQVKDTTLLIITNNE